MSSLPPGHVTSDVIDRPNLSDFPVLVVDPDPADRMFVTTALIAAGFSIRAANDYHEAKAQLLVASCPLILMTEVRLGAYNGLQLALRARAATPKIPVLVMSAWPEPVLQRDAESIGATFAVKPLTRDELLAAVCRTALRPRCQPTSRNRFVRRSNGVRVSAGSRRSGRSRSNDASWKGAATSSV